MANDTLVKDQLENVRVFLAAVLEKRGIKANLPSAKEAERKGAETPGGNNGGGDGDVLDISSVGVRLSNGKSKGRMLEFEVTFQSGNIISIVISAKEKSLVESLEKGRELPDMQFYSPIAIFKGKGVISGKTRIKSGPKEGDYMLDIRVESG
jgi:hypothetical protein